MDDGRILFGQSEESRAERRKKRQTDAFVVSPLSPLHSPSKKDFQ
jgi:hypothetical protein